MKKIKSLMKYNGLRRLYPQTSKKAGLAPGTLIHVGDQKLTQPRITLIEYDDAGCSQTLLDASQEIPPFKKTPVLSWLNIDGLHQTSLIEQLGQRFDIHPLVLEDILNTHQLPKIDVHENYLFVVIKMLTFDETAEHIHAEQVSFILGDHYVLSFQESVGDVFDPVRQRLEQARGRIRKYGCDYLLYALLDSIVDHYFVVLEKLMNKVETLQDSVTLNPDESVLQQIYQIKREMLFFRKAVWPVRELLTQLIRDETDLIQPLTVPYFRDAYDHAARVIDIIETSREMVAGMLEVYLSSLSNKMNAVMKVLTIIATIFIPLTFIAGVYGMNFQHMPELAYRWSYPIVWGLMIAIAAVMLIFFKRKKWL